MKKLIPLGVAFILLLTSSVSVFAQVNNSQKYISVEEVSEEEFLARENVGVSTIEPNTEDNIISYGLDIPNEEHHIVYDGRYGFSGAAFASKLYTNYYFVGSEEYWVKVTNDGNQNLKYSVKERFKTYETRTVAPGNTDYVKVVGMTELTKIYILFYAPSDFYGYIELGFVLQLRRRTI